MNIYFKKLINWKIHYCFISEYFINQIYIMDTQRWINEFLVALADFNSPRLCELLFSERIHETSAKKEEIARVITKILQNGSQESETSYELWTEFLTEHLMARIHKINRFKHMNEAYNRLLKIFRDDGEGFWFLPIIKKYSRFLFNEGVRSSQLDEVVNSLRKLLSACQVSQPPPESKVMGLYFALILSFKALFRLNTLQTCSSLLRLVSSEHSKLPPLRIYPKCQQVEFNYYEGRFSIYDQNIKRAEECLEFAFNHCHKDNIRNKRIILRYLVPVKVGRGKFPTEALLRKYKLQELGDILKCIKTGNIGGYASALDANQDKFIQQGIYIMMETLKILAYRNLFLKTYKILEKKQISLHYFVTAIKTSGVSEVEIEEVECILANLIFKKWIKGYISAQKKVLVLSKNDPFPKVSLIDD
ncbi:unnamed protein product [Blepharisma stoltei]|uniref:PCI domain-containing protein n=1 Tax=Blepharisma stoltei TaxID=1481888 RepID=A0AAU9IJ77_9CILI|nr:unnamed protein product [Blepharisma stoltei]